MTTKPKRYRKKKCLKIRKSSGETILSVFVIGENCRGDDEMMKRFANVKNNIVNTSAATEIRYRQRTISVCIHTHTYTHARTYTRCSATCVCVITRRQTMAYQKNGSAIINARNISLTTRGVRSAELRTAYPGSPDRTRSPVDKQRSMSFYGRNTTTTIYNMMTIAIIIIIINTVVGVC